MAKMAQKKEEKPLTILSFLKNTGIVLIPITAIGAATKYVFNGDKNERLYVILAVTITCLLIYLIWVELRLRKLDKG